MWLFKKKTNDVKVIDTGTHLPPPNVEQEMRFLSEKDRFLKIEIENQSRRTGNIIYGCRRIYNR